MDKFFKIFTLTSTALIRFTFDKDNVCYDQVGCFSNKSPWSSLTRPALLPQPPDKILTDVIFANSRVSNITLTVFPNVSPLLVKLYNPKLHTYIFCHGFASNGYQYLSITGPILQAKKDANIILINWNKSAEQMDYPQAVGDVRVGARVTKLMIERLLSLGGRLQDFHLIGHSLGAHFMAYVGKAFKGKIGRLTGLDPAGPGFGGQHRKVRFSPKDAIYTEAFHTNIGQSGIIEPVADVDYYFNSGILQPGCLLESSRFLREEFTTNTLIDPTVCAHSSSVFFYTQSILNPQCFIGKPISYRTLFSGLLNTFELINSWIGKNFVTDCSKSLCIPFHWDSQPSSYRGAVIVATKKDAPFCLNDN